VGEKKMQLSAIYKVNDRLTCQHDSHGCGHNDYISSIKRVQITSEQPIVTSNPATSVLVARERDQT